MKSYLGPGEAPGLVEAGDPGVEEVGRRGRDDGAPADGPHLATVELGEHRPAKVDVVEGRDGRVERDVAVAGAGQEDLAAVVLVGLADDRRRRVSPSVMWVPVRAWRPAISGVTPIDQLTPSR